MDGLTTNPPAVKKITLAEEFGTFCEKSAVLIVFHFKRREIEYLVITLYLAKIWDKRHVQRERLVDTVFHIHTTVHRSTRIFYSGVVVWIMGYVGREIRRKRQPYRWFDVLYAGPFTKKCKKVSPESRIGRVPHQLLSALASPARDIQSPVLRLLIAETDSRIRNAHFKGPAAVCDLRLRFIYAVPACIFSGGRIFCIVLLTQRGNIIPETVDLVFISIEQYPYKIIRVDHIAAHQFS